MYGGACKKGEKKKGSPDFSCLVWCVLKSCLIIIITINKYISHKIINARLFFYYILLNNSSMDNIYFHIFTWFTLLPVIIGH